MDLAIYSMCSLSKEVFGHQEYAIELIQRIAYNKTGSEEKESKGI